MWSKKCASSPAAEGVDVAFECTSVNKVLRYTGGSLQTGGQSGNRVDLEPSGHRQRAQRGDEGIGRARHHRLLQRPRRNHQTGGRRQINLEPFITQRIKLDELISEGFERLIHNNESAVKIIVNPNL